MAALLSSDVARNPGSDQVLYTPETLQDSTLVEINSGTCLTVEYTLMHRLVRVDSGEAIFSVAHDWLRPFVVEAGRASAKALGTRYDVYLRDHDTRITVLDGTVRVDTRGGEMLPQVVAPGEEIDVPYDSTRLSVMKHVGPDELDRMTGWVKGQLVFVDQSVGDILNEFRRYETFTAVCTDSQIMHLRLTGTFKTNELGGYLRSLDLQGTIHAEYDEPKRIVKLSWAGEKHNVFAQCTFD